MATPQPQLQIPALLLQTLTQQNFPLPSPSFLTPILTSTQNPNRPPPPLPALIATTKHRFLSSSLTTPNLLQASTGVLPPRISDAATREYVLEYNIPVQVLDVEDVGKSKGDVGLELEAERLGERTKGREVIRVMAGGEGDDGEGIGGGGRGGGGGPYKLLLQDYKGNLVWGFEMRKVEKIGYPPKMGIGCKIMLKRGTKVARGLVLLDDSCCVVLGGKVDSLDKKWREGWEKRIKEQLEKQKGSG